MRTLLSLLLLVVACTCGRAQSPVTFGQRYEMRSEILGEDRVLNVLLPTEYEDSIRKNYPVIYLLDGAVNEDFFHAAGLVRYFEDHGMMPPTILVGIANVDRKRDLTYPSRDPRDQKDLPTSGGSAKFISFLQDELPAFVGRTFRTTDHRTLVGQSLGALLATEVLLKYPGHFNDYIIVSPSLWWDKERLYNDMDSLVNGLAAFPDRLFVSAGEEYPVMVNGSRKLARLLKDKTEVIFEPLMDEDHNTILHEALYRALDKFYDPTVLRPYLFANAHNGLVIRSAPSLDSATVGKLAYGDPLGIIPTEDGNEAVVDGLAGRWIYIGSDVGRGWVFDAYVSPVPVFETGVALEDYALRDLGLRELLKHQGYPTFGEEMHDMVFYGTAAGPWFIEHAQYEYSYSELKLPGVTLGQAQVIARRFMAAQGVDISLQVSELKMTKGAYFFHADPSSPDLPGKYAFRYVNGVLSIVVDGLGSED